MPSTTGGATEEFDPDAYLSSREDLQDGPLDRGIKNTGFNSKMSAQLVLNDTQGLANTVKEAHEYNQANPGMPEGKKLYDAYEKGDGFWDGVGNTVKQIGDDYTEAKGFIPGVKKIGRDIRAMGEGVITQLPNAVAPMVGTFGGAALGAAAGSEVPVVGNVAGAVVGSLVGGSAGNALVEGGGQVQDGLQKAGIDASDTQAVKAYLDENRGQLLKQTGIKGGVLGVVDTVTGGAAHALLTGPLKSATTRALTALGIDEADHAAVAAAKKSGAIDALVKNDEKYLAAQKGAENIARNAGAAALEPVGEFTGEYFGQGLASDDWDTKNAGLEALSSIGQSAGTFGVQKAIQYGMSQGGAQNATEPSDNPTNPNPANPGSGDGAGVDPLARPDEARSRKQQIQKEIDLIQSKGSDATQEDLDREKRLNQQLMFEEANERIAQEKIKVNGQQNLTNNSDGAGQDAINLSEIAGQLPPQKPSERMGLDPNAGALSDAAALSVDSGASGNFFLPGEDVIPWDDPVATNGTEQVNPASQWDAMDATQRASVLTSVDGMSDRNGNPNVIANRLSQLNWHNMPLGAQEKVNSAITANVAAPVNNLMQQQEELQPASSIYADQENQNRDRGRADSLVQMAGIKNDPDYDRLGRSQSPSTGAPMVFAPKETLNNLTVIGHPETVTGSDGRKIQTQYAVVEASELQASHDVSGNQNPVYSSELPAGNLKALNNGRTAGIQAAYTSGNADNYKAALIGDAARLGVDPNAIAAMKQPVLVRTYDEANNKGDMGAWSNASEGLRLSAAEQANNDARVLGDLHDVVLDDDGKFSPTKNMNLIHRFVNSLPSNEASALRKRDGSVNLPAVEKRIQHAMLAIGFNNDDLINAATEDTEQSRNLMSALTQSAAGFAKLPAEAAIGTKRLVVRAAEMYQKARESGTSVEQLGRQQDLMGGYSAHEEAIADYMEKNIRAPKKVAMVLGWLADYEHQAHQSQGSMFGDDLEATKDAAIAYANQRIKQELGNDAKPIREQPATTPQQPATDHGRGTGATTGAHEGATERAGRSGGAAFGLTSQTEQQLAEQEAAQAAAKEEAAQREKAAQDKANADAEVGQFTLTGSDRAADVAAAQGQQDIFSGGRREPETPDHATRWQSMSIEDRKAVLKQEGGWPTQSNGLSVIGQQLAQQDWSKLPSGMRDKIQGLMDKTESSQQKTQPAPKQNPETKAVLEEKPEAVQQKANDILREGFSDEQYRMDSMQTRQKIADKLKSAQVSDEKGIKALTQLWMARVVVGAKQLNMLPSEYYSRFMEGEIKRSDAKNKNDVLYSGKAVGHIEPSIENLSKDIVRKNPIAAAFAALASKSNIFRFGRSITATSIDGIANQLNKDAGISFRVSRDPQSHPYHAAKYQETLESVDSDGNTTGKIHLYELRGGKGKQHFVEIDSARGTQGSLLYQAAFAWAHQNGSRLVPDPDGVSEINELRRTEAAISSALRFGTTKHIGMHGNAWTWLLPNNQASIVDSMAPGFDANLLTETDKTKQAENNERSLEAADALKKINSQWSLADTQESYYANLDMMLNASRFMAEARAPSLREYNFDDNFQLIHQAPDGAIQTGQEAIDLLNNLASINNRKGVGLSTALRTALARKLGESGANRQIVDFLSADLQREVNASDEKILRENGQSASDFTWRALSDALVDDAAQSEIAKGLFYQTRKAKDRQLVLFPPAGEDIQRDKGREAAEGLDGNMERAARASGVFATVVGDAEAKRVDVGFSRLDSPAKVAAATRFLAKNPQEVLLVVVTDKDGKPLSMLRHTIGLKDSSQVDPGIVAGWAASVHGGKNVWLSHNHPSGVSELSNADRRISDVIGDLLDGSGLSYHGVMAVTHTGEYAYAGNETTERGDIPDPHEVAQASVVERELIKTGKLSDKQISSPADAKDETRRVSNRQQGIVLMDTQNRIVGFLPVSFESSSAIRGTETHGDILRAINTSNAFSVILYSPYGDKKIIDGADNIATMLDKAGVRVLDVIAAEESFSEKGKNFGNKGRFLQEREDSHGGYFNPKNREIGLSEKSDASTFLHETSHLFLETQIEMAGMENAGAVVKHDADTVLKWFGISGNTLQERLAAWNAMTLEEKRPFHEQYAESNEQYFMEGKAPSKDLQSAFDNFRRWMKQVYKTIKKFLASNEGAKLNDDIRAVFDRLLATEEQIQEMEKARNAKALAGEKPLLANKAETKAFEAAANAVVENAAAGKSEVGKAKEPASILNTSKSKYIAAQAKEQGIKKGSPGYDAAIKKLEAAYGEDLNKALAALPFDQFHEWNVKDGSKSENMNRKAWEALREEYGTEDVSGSNVEPVSDTKTEMDRLAKEREELTGRAEEWESRIDAMTDEQAKGLFDAMNLAGSKSLDIKEALKEEHPDDLDEGYEELKQSNKTDLVASKKEAAKPVSTTNRNEFSIERYDREKDEIVTDRFERGEYVRAMISNNKSTFGEIDGVSHARNKVSIDGVWYGFGSIYKAERPAEPEKKNMAPLSKVIEKANEKYGEGLTEFDRVPEQYSGSKTPAKTSTVSPSSSPEEGQVSQRKTLEPGDVFVTLSGRHTTPFPKYSLKPSAGQSTKDDKKILAWLKENAIAEAQARDDKFNLLQFEGLNINNWSTADGYSVNLYMFGDEHGELAPFRVDETRPSSSKENAKRDANASGTRQNAKQEPKNATNKIEDFGEKLEGARKDYAQKLKEAKAVDVAAVPLSQSWPEPNYDKLLKEGVDPLIVGFARALREQMPPKPKKDWKLKGWVDQVKYMRTFAEELLSGEIAPESVVQTLNPKNEKETTLGRLATRMLGKAEMYKALGHEASLKDFDMRVGTFDSFMGESYSPAKRVYYVEKDKRRPVAWGETLEEAVSAFVKKQSESAPTTSGKKTEFGLWREGHSGQYFFGKKLGKNYVKLKRFNTLEEAKAYKKTEGFQEEMEALLEKYKTIPFERRKENEPRVGDDHRNGAAVTPEAFSEAFKFRGVQFGNYVEGSRRQQDLDNAYDALSDLAAALDIPTQAISLNGKLGLAFGARGKGGKNAAAAHFEPEKVVINLTKESGAGSLAHEWFHALDNYFAKLDGGTGEFVTNGDVNPLVPNIRPEVLAAFNDVIKAINDSGMPKRAEQLDGRRSKDYWSSREEMAARAFESYIIGKLHEQNAANDYLANIVGEDYWKADEALAGRENADTYPYPTVSEMESIGKAFDHLFDTIQTKEGDDGNVALFNRNGNDAESQQELRDEKEQTFASGLPHNLPAEETTASRALENKINEWRARRGDIGRVRVREVSAVSLPKQLHRALARFTDTTGTRVVLFRNLTPEVDDFGGVNFRDGTLYINENSQNPITLTAAHEWVHNLKKTNPSAYQELENEVRRQGRLDAWHERNIKEEGFDRGRDHAIEELTAAAVSDALTDPVFLQKLAERDQSAFRRIAKAFLEFLKTLTTSWKDQGSNAYLQDVEAFRDKLVQVLDELPVAKQRPGVIKALFLRVFHGTPHRGIEQEGFKLNKIGTGEGAQAYGWGLYFAGNKEVAEYYRETLAIGKGGNNFRQMAVDALAAEGVSVDDDSALTVFQRFAMEMTGKGGKPASYARKVQNASAPMRAYDTAAIGRALQTYVEAENKGQLYKVEIPEDDTYLLWDKPLIAQSEKVKAALRSMDNRVTFGKDRESVKQWIKITGDIPPEMRAMTGGALYSHIAGKLNARHDSPKTGSQQASEYLQSLGIPGLRYLDGVSRHRPLKDIKREFLAELPEDADFADVVELLGTGALSPKNEALVRALAADEWLGFDYPAQAISAALSKELSNFDASLALRQAVADAQEGGTHNYVIWDENLLTPEAAKIEPMFSRESDDETLRKEFSDTDKAYGGEVAYEKAKADGKTKLNYRQWVQVRTPRFKEWFGDWENDPKNASKVVAPETGEPMVVYHGTDAEFTVFQPSSDGVYGPGAYMTKYGGDASTYGSNVMPVYASLQNPYTATPGEARRAKKEGGTKAWSRAIQDKGHDGIVLQDMSVVVAFRPEQIKSATGNSGAFDGSNPDIRYSRQNEVSGFSVADIKDSLSKTFGHAADKLQRLGLVTVVQTEKEAMDLAYKARAVKAGKDLSDFDVKYSETGDVQGFYDKQTGKSFLVADNLTDETASSVLVHEVGVHMAADTTNPRGKQAMDKMIQRAGNLLKLEKSAFMDSVRQRMKEAGETSNEEAAAYIAEEYETNRANAPSAVVQWVKDFIAAVRGWLFQHGVIVKDNMLTAADIAAIARSNVKQIAKENAHNNGAETQYGQMENGENIAILNYSRAAVKQYANRAASELNKTFSSPNTLNWWHKTVGTMYNLAERSPAFKRVFDAAQGFIDDVSHYANDAADFAPTILPKLEKWSDIAKTSIASADNKAIEKPIHEGTLAWRRREDGSPVKVEDLIKESKTLSTDDKIARLLRSKKLQHGVLKMWQGMSPENLQKRVDSFYDKHLLKAGVVWSDSELKQMFGLNDKQVGLYKEYRAAIDRSLDTLARADMLRFVGEDAKDIKDAVMDADNIRDAAAMLTQHLMRKAKEDTDREKLLMELVHGIHERHDKVNELQKEGYAPLSRFGKYTVDVVDPDTGERQYFSMFETKREANAMAEAMRKEFGDKAVSQGTLSDEAYKLFSDMSPETLELFGNMLGLESTGDNTQDIAFQEYLKLTKTNRSAMRRLIHRQGIVGYSQDMPRILANFVYSNARQTAAGLNMGEMGEALNAIPKAQGELKDAAIRLADYVKNPREEAQAVRGLLFAQYLGGSVASAMVNMTQPFAVSFPYLTQFTSVKDSAAQLGRAAKELAQRNPKYDPELTAALHRAVEDGVVAPQEIHQLMAQARGSGTLSIGDGTKTGEAAAAAKNAVSKLAFGWGKVFSMAEQVNRQMTFVAAYRIAKAKGMDNAEAFARKAVVDTQFQYSKANKMQWGRGAVGGTLMTFKTYSIAYVELLHRMYTQGGPEGKRAALLALGVLMLMGGASGLPFEEDMEDVAEALAQKLGYNISIKQKRQEFLSDVFGNGMANFIENGITGLPGIPIDVSGRLGMGNLIPGTGLLKTKTDHTRDVLEIAGPIGDFASRVGSGAGRILSGDVLGGALEMSPVAIRNAVKGIDMASTGMYRDQKGYKVLDTNPVEAASKAIGFQPQSVARIQEANAVNQQQKAFYNLRAGEIRGLWAQGIFEKDASKVADARSQIADWNAKNPDQRMLISIPSVMRRVKEMSKTKDQRIAASAPRVMRAKMRDDVAEILNER